MHLSSLPRLLSCTLALALTACASPPAQDFNRLCAQEAGMVVYEHARLPADRFTPSGQVIELKGNLANAFGPDYTLLTKETELGHKGHLRKLEDKLYRKSDGMLMASRTWFVKKGTSVLGFEPKVYTCPAIGDASFHNAFIK